MTYEDDILFLSNKPLPQTATSVKLALRSREGTRGDDGDDEGVDDNEDGLLEGYVTLDPASILTYSLPAQAEPALDTSPFSFAPDRRYWDLYLVVVPFTLHPLQENKYYKQVKFTITLAHPEMRAFDLFPRNILTPLEGNKGYTLSGHGRFQAIDDNQLNLGKQLRFAPLQPKISAFGEGERIFYWVHEGTNEKKEVEPEGKYALAVLRVPRGTSTVEGSVRCRTKMQKNIFDEIVVVDPKTKHYPFQLNVQDAPIFHATRHTQRVEAVADMRTSFDISLVCALPEEALALKKVLEHQYHTKVEPATSQHLKREYYHTAILNDEDEKLSIQVSWLPGYGPDETSLHIAQILKEFQPRFVGMTGICAGDKRRVALGDLILATQAFSYETGKTKLSSQGHTLFEQETQIWRPNRQVIQSAIIFNRWETDAKAIKRPISKRQQRDWLLNTLYTKKCRLKDIALEELKQYAPLWKDLFNELREQPRAYLESDDTLKNAEELLFLNDGYFPYTDPPHPQLHKGSVASGYKVRSDTPFDEICRPVRSAIAIDMEGSAFYSAMAEEGIPFLFVKGVSDHADPEKEDSFHEYAATISGVYMLSFVRYFVTSQRVPRQPR